MNITFDEYTSIAIDRSIQILKEQGLKYRKLDFDKTMNNSYYIGGEAVVQIFYSYGGDRGKKLKANSDKLLNYINARVLKDRVRFHFARKELELEKVKNIDTDNSEVSIEKIMGKISKLLALSNSANEHEAISSSMKAQELLARYNLDIATVTGEEKKEDIEECVADVGKGLKWKYHLAAIIARSYCCKVYYHGSEEIVFYGFCSDIVIARRVFVYLFGVGNRLARLYEKTHREQHETAQGIYGSFCSGFITGIDEQLSRQCTALALIVPQEVIESFDEFSSNFKAVNNSLNTTDYGAFIEGRIEGKRALNAQYIERS